jgi:2-oxoisovalerate dehydrogenase E1 component
MCTKPSAALTREQRLRMYRVMVMSRRLDDLEIQLKRQNQIFFQISGAGHEATGVAAAQHLDSSRDWFFPYYRDRALCLGIGVTAAEMLLQGVGAAADPASGGRQMPSHWGHPGRHLVSSSSCTGSQYLHAVGCAEAARLWPELQAGALARRPFSGDEVAYVSSGEGATSEGEFHEALNTACTAKLPVLFHIEDNGYAISVPVEVQTPGGSISKLVAGYPNLRVLEFDGCCVEESYDAWAEAVAWARARQGPVLMHAHVVRPYSHSLSDDERLYRTAAEREEQGRRDPIAIYRQKLIDEHGIAAGDLDQLTREVEAELAAAREAAAAERPPEPTSAVRYVFSPDVDPCDERFAAEPRSEGEPATMVDLINRAMRDEMARDSRVVVFGEDVADASREEALEEVKGKGGVFKATHGLQREFGSHRVFNSPLAEANIVGRALGMALRGLKPVVEIQFFDYIWPAMMQLRNELAVMRWRSNNAFSCPVVVRSTYGGYLKGGAVYHSQTGEAVFAHIPGLRIAIPSNALDACGLLHTAIRCDDPVLFLEHKHLYRQTYNRAPYPGPDFTVPFGRARCVREGDRITLITWGALVKRSLDAAVQASAQGIETEVLDLRTIVPYDWEGIAASVRKTGKALVVHEETRAFGAGAEIAARIGDELFEYLDGPVRRVASLDTFVGYHPALENEILPQTHDVLNGILELSRY